MMHVSSFRLGCIYDILGEARSEPYEWYGEVSTGSKMTEMRQEHQQSRQLRWLVGRCGLEVENVQA